MDAGSNQGAVMGKNLLGAVSGWLAFALTWAHVQFAIQVIGGVCGSVVAVLTMVGMFQRWRSTGKLW